MSFRVFTTVLLLLHVFQALATTPITGRFETSLDEQYLTYTRLITSFPGIALNRDSSYQISIEPLNSGVGRLNIYLCNDVLDSCEHIDTSEVKISGSILSKKKIYCTVPLDKLNSGTHNFSFQLSISEISP
ncbi:hypothetical protein [Vibrio alginolyticus]|uniref:hypothetical protein n=1 Tax=Vibrio alginolyticus TaxID=663 RepID=UPI0015F6DCFC|nr:hypothetical protein [Vibrio alginolyticus]